MCVSVEVWGCGGGGWGECVWGGTFVPEYMY